MFNESNIEFSIFFIAYLGVMLLPIVVLFLRTAIEIDSEQPIRIYFFLYRLVEIHSDIILLFYGLKLEDFEITVFSVTTTIFSSLDLIISLFSFKALLDDVLKHEDNKTFELLIKAMCSVWCLMPLSCLFVGPVFLKRSCSWGCLRGCCCPNGCCCNNECCCPNGCSCPNGCCGHNRCCSPYICCSPNICCYPNRCCGRSTNKVADLTLPHSICEPPRAHSPRPHENTLLPGYLVQDWICKVHLNGGLINPRIVMAAAEAIVTKLKLKSNGGNINITKSNAKSLLRHMGFVNSKSTKAKQPNDFDAIKQSFIENFTGAKDEHSASVPDNLIINCGQTIFKLVPGGDWTKEKSRCFSCLQITTPGRYANDHITLHLSATKAGKLLPSQLIYSGKTDSLSDVNFPESLSCTSAKSHLSNEDLIIRYVNTVIIPYVENTRKLPPESNNNQKAIAILDECHRSEKLLNLLNKNGIVPVFVPTAFTDKLQPLDLSISREYKNYKEEMKSDFHKWYVKQVTDKINLNDNNIIFAENLVVDLESFVLTPTHAAPTHAEWIISAHKKIETDNNLINRIQDGFRNAGLL